MCRLLKKYFVFIVGAFFCSLFLVLAFTTDRKNDNSVTAKAEASYNQRLRDRLVRTTISMPLF